MQQNVKILLFLSGFIFFHHGPLLAQYASNPLVINYSKYDYRAANQNWTISMDSSGIAYFGNNSGLLEFDGSNWSLHFMPERAVARSVASDGKNRIYVGSYEEFGYMERDAKGQLHYVSLSESVDPSDFHNDEIWRIFLHNEKIYFQSFWKLFIYDGDTIEIVRPGRAIVLLMKARDRLFIHKVRSGLCELIDNRMVFIEGSEVLADDEIKAIMPYGESGFLVGAASGGLHIYHNDAFIPWDIDLAGEIASSEINAGLFVNGVYVIGTIVEGVYILEHDGTLRNHMHAGNSLINNTVQYMATDRFDNVWLGLDNGIAYINMNTDLGFHIDPSGEIGPVSAAAYYRGELYLGTNRGLFIMDFNGGAPENLRMHESLRGQIWDLQVIDGALYCGHATGTFRLTNGEALLVSSINGGFDIKKIMVNGREYLIQSTYSALVIYEKRGRHWEYSYLIRGYIEPTTAIEYDHLGNLWAEHSKRGIFRVKLGYDLDSVLDIQYNGREQGFPFEKHLGIAKVENRIVFATGQQIYTYDDINDTIIPYTQFNAALGEYAGANVICRGEQDHYWFIKGQKIAYYHIRNNQIKQVFQYDLARQGIHMSANSQKIIPLMDNLYCICLDNGFALYDNRNPVSESKPVRVCLREVSARNKGGHIQFLNLPGNDVPEKLAYSFRNLEFVFSSIQKCKIPEFSYRLIGLDDAWSEWTTESRISFTRLPWGKYRFEVKTKNLHGNEGEITGYPFIIRPPWYFSILAWIIYGSILIAAIVILRNMFLRRIQLHEERLEREKQEKIQQEQLEFEQKITKLRNDSLKSEVSHKNIQLANYTMTLIRKNELLQKIRDELEKQKNELGTRYPNFLYERISKLVDRGITSEDEWKIFENHFDQAHENFFKRLLGAYPDLTQSDLKLCAYLRMNLASKEIASLLNITTRGVEVARYRLRKRLNLETEENLVEFILRF